ncbi:hypothetical protein [uncultured Actinomyces sp.]|jgi:hypothetical protein|uniref:hypothetical protein n=1 Tax=uncultured Actinomyces sp. TaxID=249061 RepID=UPI0028037588|nr:hypothetical protein [uncultured Actinomyces sp.]
MADNTEPTTDETTQSTTPAPPAPDAPAEQEGQEDKGADYWKSRSRQWEDKAKKNAEAAKAWQEYQDSRKTEEQKAADQRAALEAERDQARREARMTKAALKHGLSLEDLELLDPTGSDEEFESRAAALAERLSKAAEPVRRRDPAVGREHVNPPAGADWLRQSLSGS